MTRKTVFECDVTGKRFGAKNDVHEIPVRRWWPREPARVHEYDVHLCEEAIQDAECCSSFVPRRPCYVAVEGTEVVGIKTGEDDRYRPRDSAVIDHYEPFFEWFEEEVIV